MDGNKPKEGMSVKELEEYAKKHRYEVFFCLLLVVSGIATLFKMWPRWSIIFVAAGAILSILMPGKIDMLMKKAFSFVFERDKTIQIVFGLFALIIGIFLPPLIFLLVGMFGGRAMNQMAMNASMK
ncbi:MAG: hypothetical protein JSR58_01360 [Verrucomicrobia bacterium]|nr:hypothetical protein [Verrucomicrobiota bacterium]